MPDCLMIFFFNRIHSLSVDFTIYSYKLLMIIPLASVPIHKGNDYLNPSNYLTSLEAAQ